METAYYNSPLGLVEIQAVKNVISSVLIRNEGDRATESKSEILSRCVRQLDEYFNGKRLVFDLPIFQTGTVFQQNVWNELVNIPFGRTVSYADIARSLHNPGSVRAVGAANGQNKIWVIVPCHRVIGSDGSLTGYAGGIECKRWLLRHEAEVLQKTGQAEIPDRSVQLRLF